MGKLKVSGKMISPAAQAARESALKWKEVGEKGGRTVQVMGIRIRVLEKENQILRGIINKSRVAKGLDPLPESPHPLAKPDEKALTNSGLII